MDETVVVTLNCLGLRLFVCEQRTIECVGCGSGGVGEVRAEGEGSVSGGVG